MERLIRAIQALTCHKPAIALFYRATVRPQVPSTNDPIELLGHVFAASVSERRGASQERGRTAVSAFEQIAPAIHSLATEQEPAAATQQIFECLCQVPQVDQKIAAMFMKFVVNIFGQWPDLRSHLYVPLDRVVLKILKTKLELEADLPDSSPVVKNPQKHLRGRTGQPLTNYSRYLAIQARLAVAASRAGSDRILIDELWLIGQLFCREYPLCHVCWLRDVCVDSQR